ncbi:multidrug effflux MFS transporter [Caulobacter sp. 17J80-11]|uniref:multidrug effflux MFS transporter n=1 Tax=Caulobacter sp. 17J80-11 TaxID=2763502 RepID=UPI001653E815|nr:multidrug effflux MFS transporter [Caulobacter sp. 17J80-11]MBC6982189.1 multidrug effflux MFS transporter [Caulobacter sp. 17J80-11]
MARQFLKTALVLGLITAVGPFAVDMYLSALPSIGASLNADAAAVQMTLTAYFLTIGLCQLGYGPLSDMIGRKPPVYAGLILFAIGSVGCALAPNVEALVGFRVLQALGACAGMVVPRAVVRDLHTGHEAARLMSMLMLVVSISPILAPLAGSWIIQAVGWRAVFWTVAALSLLGLGLAWFALPETRPAHARAGSSWAGAIGAYRQLLVDPQFMGLTLVGGVGVSAFFIYLAQSPFVLTGAYGLSPVQYSLCFALNAVGFFGAAQFTARLARRFGMAATTRGAVAGFAATLVLLAAVMALGAQQLWVMAALLFVAYGFLGLVVPTTAVISMEPHGEIAGAASALMGATHLLVGAALMTLAGLFADGTPLPMVVAIAACGVIALLIALPVLRAPARAEAQAAAE